MSTVLAPHTESTLGARGPAGPSQPDTRLPAGPHPRRASRAEGVLILAAVVVAAAAWLPFLNRPLSPDEAGFLHLAQHWRPGRSLYGDYWVDRPPLLLWLFDLAGHLGPLHPLATGLTAPGVKLLGAAATGISVAFAGVLSHLLAPRRRGVLPLVLLAAVGLLVDPLLGMPEASGEVLALPFVLGGVASLVAAHRLRWGPRAALLTLASGAAAVGAALVKQNVVDVVVMALVLLPTLSRTGAHVGRRASAFAAGGLVSGVAVLASAATRGTTPAALWEAVVVFRGHAAAVIGASASSATSDRAHTLALAALGSGIVPLLVLSMAAAWRGRHLNQPAGPTHRASAGLVWAALAVSTWEAFSVMAGGSYWLHYLTGLIPGAVLLLALGLRLPRRTVRRTLTAATVLVAVVGSAAWTQHTLTSPTVSDDARVETYVRSHAAPGDGIVAAFGDARIVEGSGLTSPYPQLWSLPVRVRDPQLKDLTRVLTGTTAPRWVVVSGRSLSTWGVDATRAQRVFDRRYMHRVSYGDWQVFEHRGHREGGTS